MNDPKPGLARAAPIPTWVTLPRSAQDILLRLCLPQLAPIHVSKLVAELRMADALLALDLVRWDDAFLHIEPTGLRIVVEESGLWRRRVG